MAIHPVAEAALLLSLVIAVGAGMIWLVKRLHGVEADDGPDASDMLTNFRELHSRGGLSDEEYRTIKTKLASQLQDEMNVAPDAPPEEIREEAESSRSSSVAGDSGGGAL